MSYNSLLKESEELGLIVKEVNLRTRDGRCKGNRIAINKCLSNSAKHCVLAEEISHFLFTCGDITNEKEISNLKQEIFARRWAHKKLVSFESLIEAYKLNIKDKFELCEYLNITTEFLDEALMHYKQKYGPYHIFNDYVIYFEPFGILSTNFNI